MMADTNRNPEVTQRAPTVITGLALTSLILMDRKPPKKTYIKIEMGEQTIKTSYFATRNQPPEWATNILVSDLRSITSIRLFLYQRKTLRTDVLLASTEIAINDLLPSNKELSVPFVIPASREPNTLVVRYETNVVNLLALSPAPLEGIDPANLTNARDFTNSVANIASDFSFLGSIQPFKEMFDRLAKVHPIASAAWSLLTLGLDIMEAQYAKDQGVVDLHKAMIRTFEIANEKDIVREWDILRSTFDAMIRQTIECQIFISNYAPKSYLRRLVMFDISEKTAKFRKGFVDLEAQFKDKMNRGVAVVTIGIREAVQNLEQDLVLSRLKPSNDPLGPTERCLAGTRTEPIAHIISWAAKSEPGLMLITGLPGTGKSTLMSSIADAARSLGRLGAYIRFERDGMKDASNVITTLAYKLASFDKRIKKAISTAVDKHPQFREMTLLEQFEALLLDPLRSIAALLEEGPIIVLVDALDECEASAKCAELLTVLAGGFTAELPFMKLIVTSRSLPDVIDAFNSEDCPHIHMYSLDAMEKATERDIKSFFDECFRPLRLKSKVFDQQCVQHNAIQELTKRACGLFIWAFTTYKFIKESPSSRLAVILDSDRPTEPEAALDEIYRTALKAVLTGPGSNSDIKSDMKTILGAMLVMQNPPGLTHPIIDGILFHGSIPKSHEILPKLACVIAVDTFRFIHKSFVDFLLDRQRSGDDWYIDISQHHMSIALSCLCVLQTHFDQIALDSVAYTSHSAIDAVQALGNIHKYPCAFWMFHFGKLDPINQDLGGYLRVFFQQHFFKWLQSMSILGFQKLPMFQLLPYTNHGSCSATDKQLWYDAYQFAQNFYPDIKEDPFLGLTTGLTFCADNSLFCTLATHSLAIPAVTGIQKNQLLLLWEIEDSSNTGAVFFPDGSKFVSFSSSSTLHIWDAYTGETIYDLMDDHNNRVLMARVSSDGMKILSMDNQSMVIIWDAQTGQHLRGPFLVDHNKPKTAIDFSSDFSIMVFADTDNIVHTLDLSTLSPVTKSIHPSGNKTFCTVFSPNGKKILSGGADNMLQMWDAVTGNLLFEAICLGNSVGTVAFSPDGSKFVSGSTNGTIQIWDSEKGISTQNPIKGHKDSVRCVSFSNDGTKIISGSYDQTIQVWDSATGNLLAQPIQGHLNSVISVCVSPDDTKILSTSADNTICMWDISTLEVIATGAQAATYSSNTFQLWNLATRSLLQSFEMNQQISDIAFSPSGDTFVSCGWDNAIRIWDTATSLLVLPPIEADSHGGLQLAVSYSPSGKLIVSGSTNGIIQLWDAQTRDPVNEPIHGHASVITQVSFSPDSTQIVSASSDHTARVWDVATGKELLPALQHQDVVRAASFSPDGMTIVSGSFDKTVCVWDVSNGQALHDPLCAHTGQVTYVAWSPDGKIIASASTDSTVKLWNFPSCELIQSFRGFNSPIITVKFWQDGQKLLSSLTSGVIHAWDISTGQSVFEPIHAHMAVNTYADVSPDNSKILTGSLDGTLRVWNATNGAPLSAPIEDSRPVTSLFYNTEVVVVGAANNTIHVWNVSTMTMPYEPLVGHKAIVLSLSLDPKSTRLVSGSKDGSCIVWDLIEGKLLYQVNAYAGVVTSVTFSPDSSTIVTGSSDRAIKLWEASTGASLLDAAMTGHDNDVVSVAFSPDSLHLVSASLDNTIRLWDASTGASIFAARISAARSFKESLDKVVFSADGQSLIYALVNGAIYKWPFRALSSTVSSTLTAEEVERMFLIEPKLFVKFPQRMPIMTSFMTSQKFFAVRKDTYQLITVDLS